MANDGKIDSKKESKIKIIRNIGIGILLIIFGFGIGGNAGTFIYLLGLGMSVTGLYNGVKLLIKRART
jgi:hypothetical protein